MSIEAMKLIAELCADKVLNKKEETILRQAIEQAQQVEREGSPCPEFWDWLPRAYNFEGDGGFTKYNMEVAFLAGKQSVEQAQKQEPAAHQVYRCQIKTRKQIDKEIPREKQGWWADISAGQKILLRQAVQADIDRCTLNNAHSKDPADYMCETFTNGSLVSKAALEYMNPEQNVYAYTSPPQRQPVPPSAYESLLRDMTTIAAREVPKGLPVADFATHALADAELCEHDTTPQRQPLTDEQAETIQKDSDVKTALLNYSVARNDRAAIALVKAIAAHDITGEQK